MAQVSSGSFNTVSNEGRNLKFSWSVDNTSIAGNYKEIYWSLVADGDSGYVYGGDFKVVIDGETVYESATRIQLWKGTVVASGKKKLYHNNVGNKSFTASVSASIYTYVVNTKSGSWELPTIPRYAKITSFSVTPVDETSVKFHWTTDVTCDYAWYSVDNGFSWGGMPRSNIVGGFTAGTTYNFMLKVRRADSQLTTDSGNYTQSTYNYPHCTSSPNFTIGNALTLDFYNPLGRSITVAGYSKKDGSEIFTGSTNGTRLVGFNDANSVNKQYASIPNSQSSEYTVVVVYNGTPMTRDAGNVYQVRGDEVPTINEFDYIDSNKATVRITGDETHIVQNKSALVVRFQPATANKGAGGISQYYIECNGKTAQESQAGLYHLGAVDSESDVDLKLTVVDSRGLSASKTIKVTVIAYRKPTAIVELKRLNNYEDETYLTVDASISSVNGKNDVVIDYRYKEVGGSYGSVTRIRDNEKQTLSLDKNKVFVFEVSIADAIGSLIIDEYVLGKGVFPLFIDTEKNSVGINCFPAEEKSLEVNGFNLFNVYKSCKNILLGSPDGLKITINSFGGTDKFALIVAGADNASMVPVFKVIHIRSDAGWTQLNLGLDSTVSVSGNNIHINASQWSHFTVFAPLGAEITLSNSAL